MRKISLLLLPLAALSLASCVNDSLEEKQSISKEVIITASTGGNSTKTYLLPGSAITGWLEEDTLSVFSFYQGSEDINVPFHIFQIINNTTARFQGRFTSIVGAKDPEGIFKYGDKWAVYPYSSSNLWKGNYMEVTIPKIQTAYPGTFDPKAQPLVARSNSTDFAFYNVAGNICFHLPDSMSGIKRIEFKGRNLEHLTGKAQVSYVGDSIHPSVCGDPANSDTMIVLLPKSGCDTIASDTTYFLSMIPAVLANGLEMVFYRQTSYATLGIDGNVSIGRNQVIRIRDCHFNDVKFIEIPVSEIIMPTSLTLDPDDQYQIVYKIQPDSAHDKRITWSSSNPDCISVDSTGLVRALKPGCSATITAQSVACPAITAQCLVTVKSVINLSESGNANCYIVPKRGHYMFDATVKGKTKSLVSTEPIDSACLIWKSFGTQTPIGENDLVKDIYFKDGFIYFTIPGNQQNGNATVAALSSSGEILWSWHLWICMGYDPELTEQKYPNGAGTFMDRNLGATSICPDSLQILGLFYQWGRKDPFLADGSFRENEQKHPQTYYSQKKYERSIVTSSSSAGSINYTTTNPTAFIVSNNSDWVYDYSLNNRWGNDIDVSDPCPNGWTLPSPNFMQTALGLTETVKDFSDNTIFWNSAKTNKRGMNFKSAFGTSFDVLYPYTGRIIGDQSAHIPGAYYLNKSNINIWTKNTKGYNNGKNSILYIVGTTLQTGYAYDMREGVSVRCVKVNN